VHVFVSRRVPERVRAELEERFEVDVHDSERPLAHDELLGRVKGRAGLVTMLSDRVDDELLEAAGPGLRVVANYAVGVDNVDLVAASRRRVVVTNTPDVLARATAELTLALLLALVRRIAEGDRLVRRGEPWVWAPTFMLSDGVGGKTLGCVGFGRIGREVGTMASALGMKVAYTNRRGPLESPFRWLPLAELLARADVVSLHCPLTPETHHLIDDASLAAMRAGAYLVNAARGPIVDERALARAIARGHLAGAALDVYEREPEVEEELLGLERVVLTPHLGSATASAREAMGMLCVDALYAALIEARLPANAVNPDAWRDWEDDPPGT
jgi:glyoxylate reductase